MNYLDLTLAQITQKLPGATAILNQYELSFCCGGSKTLREALYDANIEQDGILTELSNLDNRTESKIDWNKASNQEIITYILSYFHQQYRIQLPELVRLAERVQTVHGNKPHCPIGLASHLGELIKSLEIYMNMEQEVIFSLLPTDKPHMLHAPIHAMKQDHEELLITLNKIDDVTNGIRLPDGACNTWRALYFGLSSLKLDLLEHIRLENEVFFPRFEQSEDDTGLPAGEKAPVHGEDFCCGSCGGS